MYKTEVDRKNSQVDYLDYNEYLSSLKMVAHINKFAPIDVSRITQLTNKTNQFNLTTKRLSQAEIEEIMLDESFIAISGRLADKFSDNGITSIVIGKIKNTILHMFHNNETLIPISTSKTK